VHRLGAAAAVEEGEAGVLEDRVGEEGLALAVGAAVA
jgi:hypothetical protein